MKVTIDLEGETADRVFDLAAERGLRVDEAARALLVEAVAKSVETPPAEPAKPAEPKAWQQPRTPLIERVHEFSSSWDPAEVAQFEDDVLRLHDAGATDGEISVETEATRFRVARTRRRLGLPAIRDSR